MRGSTYSVLIMAPCMHMIVGVAVARSLLSHHLRMGGKLQRTSGYKVTFRTPTGCLILSAAFGSVVYVCPLQTILANKLQAHCVQVCVCVCVWRRLRTVGAMCNEALTLQAAASLINTLPLIVPTHADDLVASTMDWFLWSHVSFIQKGMTLCVGIHTLRVGIHILRVGIHILCVGIHILRGIEATRDDVRGHCITFSH